MALADELQSQVKKIFAERWDSRKGLIGPAPADLRLANDALEFDNATVLYADLSGSTALVDTKTWQFAAEIYKTYLYCAARIVRAEGGTITSYDGDRIMGIFVGSEQCDQAMRCALKINHAVRNIINPAIKAQYTTDYAVTQTVGIDMSPIRAARTGARGDNDIVWVGRAANYAAKLTNLKSDKRSWVTKEVYDAAAHGSKFSIANNCPMWGLFRWEQNNNLPVYGSTWTWPV